MKTSIIARNAQVDALAELLNGGFIKIFSGAQPDSPETSEPGTLLATLEFGNPAFTAAINGVAAATPITEETDAASGVAGWFRTYKSDGVTPVYDGSVGLTGSYADMKLRSVNISAHIQVSLTALTITLPQ